MSTHEILDMLNSWTPRNPEDAIDDPYNPAIFDETILWMPEYDPAATEALDAESAYEPPQWPQFVLKDGTVVRLSSRTGSWEEDPS